MAQRGDPVSAPVPEVATALPSVFPSEPGAYVLWIDLDRPVKLVIPRLGSPVLGPGRYAYCGSARGPGGIRARVARHLRPAKKVHWHIDRLTAAGTVTAVMAAPGGNECELMDALCARNGAAVPAPGFGSSDCRRCTAHLVSFGGVAATEIFPASPPRKTLLVLGRHRPDRDD